MPKISRRKMIEMKFIERIKQLREERQKPQQQFAAALEIDATTHCKIERSGCRTRKKHIPIVAELLQGNREDLLTLWLADQITAVVADEKKIADKALNTAKENITNHLNEIKRESREKK